MERIYIDVSAHSEAASEVVFGLLADGASWPDWSPIESFELERPGDPPPEGVGAIRVFRKDGTIGRDQIVELVPGRRLSYVSLSGPPVRDYRAQIDLEGTGEGTAIKWRASFSPRIVGTGWLLDWGLRSFLEECARGLAEHAAHVPATVPTTTDQAGAAPLGARRASASATGRPRRQLEALADALIAKAPQGDVSALGEAIHELVGRPTKVVQDRRLGRVPRSLPLRSTERPDRARRSHLCLGRIVERLRHPLMATRISPRQQPTRKEL